MSETVPNADVEDVLSSIRRLVSSDGATPAAPQDALAHDKLLLTPALRVEADDAPPGPAPDPAEAAFDTDTPDTDTPETAAPGAETPEEDAPGATAGPAGPDNDDIAEVAPVRSLKDRISELEAAVSAQSNDFEPDGSEETDQETPRTFMFGTARSAGDGNEPAGGIRELRRAPTLHLAGAELIDEEAPMSVGHEITPEEAGPESAGADTDAAPEQGDPTEGADAADMGDDVSQSDQETDTMAAGAVIDEEALQAMVADLVRRELQGSLGERITRNVRKLVRSEIQRALAAREFD